MDGGFFYCSIHRDTFLLLVFKPLVSSRNTSTHCFCSLEDLLKQVESTNPLPSFCVQLRMEKDSPFFASFPKHFNIFLYTCSYLSPNLSESANQTLLLTHQRLISKNQAPTSQSQTLISSLQSTISNLKPDQADL
ncbi:hypothetical protein HQ43_05580 [Porphyromonas canoris]|uniref:Uncharacterized protein n=1 Tax=Porphyromonas canoris TaxID=36875 RepID=A0ABR4XIT0_9PORP|nr:hypothetical protein HQ43_05580 [Porphyromonas canoris]